MHTRIWKGRLLRSAWTVTAATVLAGCAVNNPLAAEDLPGAMAVPAVSSAAGAAVIESPSWSLEAGLKAHIARAKRVLIELLGLKDEILAPLDESPSQTGAVVTSLLASDPCKGQSSCSTRKTGDLTTYEWTTAPRPPLYRVTVKDEPTTPIDTVTMDLRKRTAMVTWETPTESRSVLTGEMVVGSPAAADDD